MRTLKTNIILEARASEQPLVKKKTPPVCFFCTLGSISLTPNINSTSTQTLFLNQFVDQPHHTMACALIILLVAASAFTSTVIANSEGDALYALRRSLNDPDNVLQSWDPNLVSPCTWFHITCNQDNRVTRVDLGNSKLSGHLVPELGKLEYLQYLELYKNTIQGPIPAEFGHLKNLISLDLYNNNITGNIPPTLGKLKSLVFLRLNDNRLTGRIPRELTGISSLKVMDVSNNDLCGTIPTTGPFEHIPLNNFENNPRLEGPELLGLASYDTNCS